MLKKQRARNLEAKEGMKIADRQREFEKNMYQMDLYTKVDQKVEELAKREIELEKEKAEYEQAVLERVRIMQTDMQKQYEVQRLKIENYQIKLWEKFMNLIEQHKEKIESDAKETQDRFRLTLEAKAEEELAKQENLIKLQTITQAQLEGTMDGVRAQLSNIEKERDILMQEIEELQARNLQTVTEYQQREDVIRFENSKEISEIRNSYISQINEKESQIMKLYDQLSQRDREMSTIIEREKAEIEKRIHDKYDRIHRDFKEKFIREVTQAKSEEHKRLTDQELIIHEQGTSNVRTSIESL